MNQSKKGFIYTNIGATQRGINVAFSEFLFLKKGVTSDSIHAFAGGCFFAGLSLCKG